MYIGGASKSDTTKYYVRAWVFVLYHTVAKIRNNYTLCKKWSFPLRISPVNVSKFADLDTFTGEILNGKLHFLCSDTRCCVKKKCSKNFSNFHRKTTALEATFNRVAGLQIYNFIKKSHQQKCFPENFSKFLGKWFILKGCSSYTASSYLFRPSKSWSMLYHGSVLVSSE